MISSQSDKLRAAAQACRSLGRHEMEQTLLDAADLILELRDNLQCANEAVRDAEHDESMAWDRVRKAEAENAKLRDSLEFANNECEKVSLEYLNLQAENAKLRELVLARFACDSDACESCADCQLSGSKPFRCAEVAQELCVEVEG